jgi:hypothetical protein
MFRKSFLILLYLFSAGLILLVFVAYPGMNGYSKAMFSDMVYGDAYRPFVYRTLVPSLIRGITEVTPESIERYIEAATPSRYTLSKLVALSDISPEYIYEYIVCLAIVYICFIVFILSLRQLIKHFYDLPDFVADIAPPGALLILPIFFRYCNYVYDPATLCLFSIGILSIARRKWALFYIIYILAGINKETSILLSLVFLVSEYRNRTRTMLFLHLAVQLLLWLVLRECIILIYKDNPGTIIQFHFITHTLTMAFRPLKLIYILVVFCTFFLLIRHRWKEKPAFLRQSFMAVFITIFGLVLFIGIIDELRVFYEVYPLAFLLSLPTITEVFGIDSPGNVKRTPSEGSKFP